MGLSIPSWHTTFPTWALWDTGVAPEWQHHLAVAGRDTGTGMEMGMGTLPLLQGM